MPSPWVLGPIFNFIAIVISLFAVIYWVRLYRALYKKDEREIRGWRWIFVAVLGILLFNITSAYLLVNISDLYVAVNVEKLFPNAKNQLYVLDMGMMEVFNTLGRTIIGLSMTVGAYLIYAPMRRVKGVQYRFVPVTPTTETKSQEESKYSLAKSSIYMIKDERPTAGSRDYMVKGTMPNKALSIFKDLVTHDIEGLCISRTHPEKIREMYDLRKIPVLWLSRSQDYRGHLEPSDLVELMQTIKEFVTKSANSVVLLDGLEYLITQNSFEDILRFIQSLNDIISTSNSRVIIPVDQTTIDEKQLHLLQREMNEITSVWDRA